MKKLFVFLIVIILALSVFSITSLAANESYVLDGSKRVAVPNLYEFNTVYQSFTFGDDELFLNSPQDMYVNSAGYVFIADSSNNRIVKLNKNGELLNIFDNSSNGGFNNPQGIFADDNGNIYVGDTDNGRIVHLDYEGNFVEEFGRPADLPDDVNYLPAKLCISTTGMIYVVHGQSIISIDSTNTFRGYFGQSEISFDLTEALIRIFASEEQKATRSKRLAASYTNVAIDKNNILYAATLDSTLGEIKRLNSVGINTYRETGSSGAFSINFKQLLLSDSYVSSSGTAFYGDRFDDNGAPIKPKFSDIAFDDYGLIYAVDQVTCRVFVYDSEGNLLGTFGSKGIQKGKLYNPTSLCVASDGTVYILDAYLSNLQLFKPTAFKNNIQSALGEFYNGNYDKAFDLWQSVLKSNENYTTALNGIAKCYFKQGEYQSAMENFKKADNTKGYSEAFAKYSHDYFRANFLMCVIIAVIIFAAFCAAIVLLSKVSKRVINLHNIRSEKRFGLKEQFGMGITSVFHPCETFDNIRYMRGRVNWIPALSLPIIAVFVRFIYMNIVHYPLADVSIREASYLLETVKILLPFITFVIAAYAITAIMSGEVRFKELYFAAALCFTPYILFTLPIGGISNVLSTELSEFYTVLKDFILIWQLFMFFNCVRVTNRFTVKKTVGVVIIILLSMVLIWIIAFLIIVLLNQVYIFLIDIFREIGYR